jgi:hypothetical protein
MTTSPYADTIGQQQRAVVVLLSLLAHDLPPVAWNVYAVAAGSVPPMLDGLLSTTNGTPEMRLAQLKAWADHMGIRPTWETYEKGDGNGKLGITALITGVRVTVWTPLPSCPPEYLPDPGPDPDAAYKAAQAVPA